MHKKRLKNYYKTALPYWDHSVDFNVVSWYPFGLDFSPFSINEYHSPILRSIADLSVVLDSEFFCMASFKSGYVGALLRDSMLVLREDVILDLGFTMVFGYSKQMESLIVPLLSDIEGLRGGITRCCLWNKDIMVQNFKAIILVSENPFFNENDLLEKLETSFEARADKKSVIPYFAEKYGYTRFFIPFETDNLTELIISRYLQEMEFDETRSITGPSPEVGLPGIAGIALVSE